MVMRSRGGGAGAPNRGARSGGVVRPVYEDFKPKSEWQQDYESHILSINLPGFTKEQIKVSTEGHNTIRVRGERLVGGNKWSRFSDDFQVPQNSEINSIRTKFQGGTLNITIPKIKTDKKPQENLPPTPKTTLDVQKQPTPIKAQDKVDLITQVITTNQQTNEKNLEPQKSPVLDPTAKKSQGNDRISGFPRDEEKKEHIESKEKEHIASEKITDDLTGKKTGGKEELLEMETAKKTTLLGNEKYKKVVKGIAELNEERQLLVNMGVGLLVIVALTAHITYKFATGKYNN